MTMTAEAMSYIYEAFADAGIEPAKARRIERAILESQRKTEKEIFDHVMSKQDGLQLRSDLLTDQSKQMKWYVSLMFVAVAAATAGVALIQKLI